MKNKYSNFVLNKIHKVIRSLKRTNEEGGTLRHSRARRFRKKYRVLLISIQVLAVWYFFVLSAIQLNTFTNAAFNDVEQATASLHVQWPTEPEENNEWDKSSLSFDGSTAWGACSGIYSSIKNGGEDMQYSTWKYFVFKITDNKKPPASEAIYSAIVPNLNKGEVGELSFTNVTENGNYRFAVRRPLGHEAKNNPDENGYTYIWSDNIIEVKDCAQPASDKVNTPNNSKSAVESEGASVEQKTNSPETPTPETNTQEKVPETSSPETNTQEKAPETSSPESTTKETTTETTGTGIETNNQEFKNDQNQTSISEKNNE
nr:amyloid fiber anchoring/assembly protein TapA [Fredinandcohnia onubensis]